MDYNINGAEDGPGDEDEVVHSGEDVIADSEMDGIEADGNGCHSKNGIRVEAGVDDEGW